MITMPVWVFLLLVVGGMVFNVYLMWANNETRTENRRLRRRLHRHERPAVEETGRIPLGDLTGGGQL